MVLAHGEGEHSRQPATVSVPGPPFSDFRASRFRADLRYCTAKTFNALVATAAIFPIWRLARRFMRDGIAVAVAAISVVGVPASYAALVMAESLFFFLFWLLLAGFGALRCA